MGSKMIDIREILCDEDFIQPIEFGIVDQALDGESMFWMTHNNTNVQPASGDVLQRLAEGERSKPTYQVFTLDSFPIKNGDYMIYKDQKYRCVTDENWSDYGYYDALFQLYSGAQDIYEHVPNPYE